MLQLEKELHEKQQLELEVERLNGTLQVMKHLEGDDDGGDIHEKMEKLSVRFEREKKRLEDLSGDLVRKERESITICIYQDPLGSIKEIPRLAISIYSLG